MASSPTPISYLVVALQVAAWIILGCDVNWMDKFPMSRTWCPLNPDADQEMQE